MNQIQGAGDKNGPAKPASVDPAALDIAHRRNRLAGIWAAELLGLIGHAAQDYVRSVMHLDHGQDEAHGDDNEKVLGKLAKDLAGRVTRAEIREMMSHFLAEARRQIRHDRRE